MQGQRDLQRIIRAAVIADDDLKGEARLLCHNAFNALPKGARLVVDQDLHADERGCRRRRWDWKVLGIPIVGDIHTRERLTCIPNRGDERVWGEWDSVLSGAHRFSPVRFAVFDLWGTVRESVAQTAFVPIAVSKTA